MEPNFDFDNQIKPYPQGDYQQDEYEDENEDDVQQNNDNNQQNDNPPMDETQGQNQYLTDEKNEEVSPFKQDDMQVCKRNKLK